MSVFIIAKLHQFSILRHKIYTITSILNNNFSPIFQKNQYLLYQPFASITAWTLLGIEFNQPAKTWSGITSHASLETLSKRSRSCLLFPKRVDSGHNFSIEFLSLHQMFSIGFKFGEYAGHSRTEMLCFFHVIFNFL